MDDLPAKRELMSRIGSLSGLWEVHLKPRRRTRTLNQNAYYWSAVVQPFTTWLHDAYGDPSISKEQAHELLKTRVLGMKELLNEKTGRIIQIIPDSRNLETVEFAHFIEGCAKFLAEFCNVVVLSSDLFFEKSK